MSKVRCEVVGPCAVAGVRKPGTVELDDEHVNVKALVRAGHVRPAADKPTAEAKAKQAAKDEAPAGGS